MKADIVAFGADDKPVLLVEVKSRPMEVELGRQQLVEHMRRLTADASVRIFGMLIDIDKTRVYVWANGKLSEQLDVLPTPEILSVYDPEFGQKTVYEYYLTTLVEAWLRDCAYQWKSAMPPGYERLTALGLAERLRGGTTMREYSLAA